MKIRILCLLLLLNTPFAVLAKPSIHDKLVVMWQVQKNVTDNEIGYMKYKGVNVIQSFNIKKWKDEETKRYLDRAYKAGLGVIVPHMRIARKGKDKWIIKPNNFDINFINKWKDHPALFAWQLFDEPASEKKKVPAIVQDVVYKFLKEHDPHGKVYLSWNGTKDGQYKCCFSEKSFDILDLHAYISKRITPRQEDLIKKFKRYNKKKYPIVISLRIYNAPSSELPNLEEGGLKMQYDYFFNTNKITNSVGFYGWELTKNRGIKNSKKLEEHFSSFQFQNIILKIE